MALKAPTPPTPPTHPAPPQVDLMEGGSVKETTRPQSHGPQTEDEIHEKQAREAVANGDGALSKTTVTDGKKDAKGENAKDAQGASPMAEQGKTGTQIPAGGSRTERSTIRQDSQAQALMGEEHEAEKSQAQQLAPPRMPEAPGDHGMLYWGAVLLAITLLVAVLLRKILFREKGKEPLVITPYEPEVKAKAGMTAGEVLGEIRQQEQKRPMAPSLHVAREYAAQAAAPSPREKKAPPGKPSPPRPQGKKEGEERERFEVRV